MTPSARAGGAARGRLRSRRYLGQHFLVDANIAERIVAAAELEGRPPVLEIGPGRGALTDRLYGATDRLYLVEIDPELAGALRRRYEDDPTVIVVEADVLAADLAALLPHRDVHVVGNLPYSVASQILLRIVDLRDRCPLAVVMLQEEVARRVAARPGGRDYGVLSLMVQLYATVEWRFRVSPRCFAPPPHVTSAVVRLRLEPAPRVAVEDPALFRWLVRSVFQHRRKMLRTTLSAALPALGVAAAESVAVLREAGIDAQARPETVCLEGFSRLTAAVAARAPTGG